MSVANRCVHVQAFDKGPWPRMSGRERGTLMTRLASLMEVCAVRASRKT